MLCTGCTAICWEAWAYQQVDKPIYPMQVDKHQHCAKLVAHLHLRSEVHQGNGHMHMMHMALCTNTRQPL